MDAGYTNESLSLGESFWERYAPCAPDFKRQAAARSARCTFSHFGCLANCAITASRIVFEPGGIRSTSFPGRVTFIRSLCRSQARMLWEVVARDPELDSFVARGISVLSF